MRPTRLTRRRTQLAVRLPDVRDRRRDHGGVWLHQSLDVNCLAIPEGRARTFRVVRRAAGRNGHSADLSDSVRVGIEVAAGREGPQFDRHGEPVTLGVAFARGLACGGAWSLRDTRGVSLPVQVSELDRWSDGSTRWLLIDFQADVPAGGRAHYELSCDRESREALRTEALRALDVGDTIVVITGAATFHVPRSGGVLLTNVAGADQGTIEPAASTVVLADAAGTEHPLEISHAAVERSGPVRVEVRVIGRFSLRDHSAIEVIARLHFYRGLGTVRVELSATNPRRAIHAGGHWDLGDAGSLLFRDLSVVCTAGAPITSILSSIDSSAPLTAVGGPLEIYQDSSGGERWRSANHQNRQAQVPVTFRGYRMSASGTESHGYRATPIVIARAGKSQIAQCVPKFWQEFPKAIEVDERRLTVRLFPRQFADLYELQGGERKTHVFCLCFGPDSVTETPLAWVRSPALAVAASQAYQAAGVWRALGVGSDESKKTYRTLVDVAIEGKESFENKREVIDEYGWRHFGDLYADHEAVNEPGLVSHYNNQYDAIAGLATRFCETGDGRWWTAMRDLAAHVVDIDIYHCTEDRSAYNNGLFWHTSHYSPAHTAGHRSYSRRAGAASGGLSNEHNYTTGLLLHFFLTGCDASREAVLQLAGWVLDMDDGAKGRFWWIDRGETGLASATRDPNYHGPGRGAAYSINALLDAHRLTGEPRYLLKAERLVERCIHPTDDPDAMDLLDAERRWSYTVFLQVLGKYLEYRAEKGLLDREFEYARAALLRYAYWMAENERPYLDRSDQLEYPTETWPAQDIRKGAVLEFAARCVADPEGSSRFMAAANRFFNYAVSTLGQMPTRHLTRPIVLLLAYGFQRPLLESVDLSGAVSPAVVPIRPVRRFVASRRRVVVRLAVAATALVSAALALLWLIVAR